MFRQEDGKHPIPPIRKSLQQIFLKLIEVGNIYPINSFGPCRNCDIAAFHRRNWLLPNRYFYSVSPEEEFQHVIRCQPDDTTTHDGGMDWLAEINEVISVLEYTEGRDYQRWALSLLAFPTEEKANAFYVCMQSDLGRACLAY